MFFKQVDRDEEEVLSSARYLRGVSRQNQWVLVSFAASGGGTELWVAEIQHFLLARREDSSSGSSSGSSSDGEPPRQRHRPNSSGSSQGLLLCNSLLLQDRAAEPPAQPPTRGLRLAVVNTFKRLLPVCHPELWRINPTKVHDALLPVEVSNIICKLVVTHPQPGPRAGSTFCYCMRYPKMSKA